MQYEILCYGFTNEQNIINYLSGAFKVKCCVEELDEVKPSEKYKYILSFGDNKVAGSISINEIWNSEYTPIFKYLFDRGFRVDGEMANALFVAYILKKDYCKNRETLLILYEAVQRTVAFSETIELWDSNYQMYDGIKGVLLHEIDIVKLW